MYVIHCFVRWHTRLGPGSWSMIPLLARRLGANDHEWHEERKDCTVDHGMDHKALECFHAKEQQYSLAKFWRNSYKHSR